MASLVNPNSLNPTFGTLNSDSFTSISATNNSSWGSPMPIACTFKGLYVQATTASLTGTDNVTVTVLKNSLATLMTCSVTLSTTAGGQVTCNDTAHPFSVTVGDSVALQFTQSATAPVAHIGISTTCQ
jgi:hypothetical protein